MLFGSLTVDGFALGGFRSSAMGPVATPTPKYRVAPARSSRYGTDPTFFLESIPKAKGTGADNDKIEAEAVDEYLEFLDRRYRRLHDNDSKSRASSTIAAPFSVLNWLKHQEQWTDAIISKQIQDDALYVLGVAGLASKRLLHKHHIPESFTTPIGGRTMAMDAIDIASSSSSTAKTGALSSPSSSGSLLQQEVKTRLLPIEKIVAHVAAIRQALITYQTRQVVATLKALLYTPVMLMKKLWAIGGGKRSLTIAVTVATILTIALVRPLLLAIGKASLNMVRSSS